MELMYLSVKDEVQKHKVSIQYVKTDMMVVDPLTKGLQPKAFKEHVQRMGVSCKRVQCFVDFHTFELELYVFD